MSEWIENLRKRVPVQECGRWMARISIPALGHREAVRLMMDVGMGLLLSQARLFGHCAPFAIAWMAARLLWDKLPLGVLAGMLVGLLVRWEPLSWANGWQIVACALLLGGRLLQPMIALPAPWGMAVLAGAVTMAPMPFFWKSQADVLFCLISGLAAAVTTPAFERVVALLREQETLEWDDRICCLLCMALAVMGGTAYALGRFDVGGTLTVFFVLGAAWVGGGSVGIVCGTALGFALALGGHAPFVMITLPVCGMVISLVRKFHRVYAALCCVLANALVTLCINGSSEVILSFANVAVGCLAFVLTPPAFWSGVAHALELERQARLTSGNIAIQWLQMSANALGAMAESLPEPDEDDTIAVEQLAVSLCEGCIKQQTCWGEAFDETSMLMEDLLDAARYESLQPRELSHMARIRNCQRSDLLPDALQRVNRTQSRSAQTQAQQLQATHLARVQFTGYAGLLQSLCTLLTQASPVDKQESMAIARVLSRTPWKHCSVLPYRLDNLLHIILIPPAQSEPDEMPINALEQTLQMSFRCDPLWDGALYLQQQPMLRVKLGAADLAAHGQQQNGDTHLSQCLPRGMLLLALSDGMGNGEEAGRESETMLRLIKQGLEAGFVRRQLFDLVNDLMRSCKGEERYATLDLCLIDLKTGDASFDKLGACPSYLIRQGKCRRLEGGTLPVGILEDVAPRSFRMRLCHGDLLVMVSDGIADAFEEDRALLQVMASLPLDPDAFAKGLMEAALQRTQSIAKDDMTVLVASLEQEDEGMYGAHAKGAGDGA